MKEEKGHHEKIYKQIVGCWKKKKKQGHQRERKAKGGVRMTLI